MYHVNREQDAYSTVGESGISSGASYNPTRANALGSGMRPSTSSDIKMSDLDKRKMMANPLFSFVANNKSFGVVNPSFVVASSMSEWTGKTPMNMPFFQFWLDVLENDDTTEYKNIMKRTTKSQRCGLLNGRFTYDNAALGEMCKGKLHVGDYERPIFIAVVNASKSCIIRMLRDGVQVVTPEKNGSNIIHALVLATLDFPEMERSYINVYEIIMEKCNQDEIRQLHLGEDNERFRPAELAAKFGVWGLFRAIMESNIYEEYIGQIAIRKFYRYNITDYESGRELSREIRSPIRYITYIDKNTLRSFEDYKIMEMPIIRDWIHLKLRRNAGWLFLWFLLRAFILCTLIALDPKRVANYCLQIYHTNSTSGMCEKETEIPASKLVLQHMTFYRHIGLAVCIICLIFLIIDFLEILIKLLMKNRRMAYQRMPSGYLGYTTFYRLSQATLYMLSVVFIIISSYDGEDIVKGMIIVKALYLPLVITSFMYFMELVPPIGYFAIMLQKMVLCVINFLLYALGFNLIFTILFIQIIEEQTFSSFGSMYYFTFMVSTGIQGLATRPYGFLQVSHITFYYLCTIILLCFLIAAMVTVAMDNRPRLKTIQTIRRLDAAILVDERVGRWFRKMCGKKRRIEIVTVKSLRMQSLDLN